MSESSSKPVAALYVRRDSIYKQMEAVDCWDCDRDAQLWPGGSPCISHPPCGQWGRLRQFAHSRPAEKALGLLAVDQVRTWGGVLEHPMASSLWTAAGLPRPGDSSADGSFTLSIPQHWFGHRSLKLTWLYVVGVERGDIPAPDFALECVERSVGQLGRAAREATPLKFAEWLVSIARLAAR